MAQFETAPKQLYTTTETQFGNQRRVEIPGSTNYPVYESYSTGPARAKGDKYAEGYVTVDGVTIKYVIISNGDIAGVGWYIIYYYEGTTLVSEDDNKFNWGQIRKVAEDHAREIAQEIANERSHMTPIGDTPIIAIVLFVVAYALYDTFRKNK